MLPEMLRPLPKKCPNKISTGSWQRAGSSRGMAGSFGIGLAKIVAWSGTFRLLLCGRFAMVRAMQIRRRLVTLSIGLAALAACGPNDNDSGPGGVSIGEAKALDEAAEMIEARRLPEDAMPKADDSDIPLPPQDAAEQPVE